MSGLPRYAASADANQKHIVEGLRKLHVSVIVIKEPCDLLCGHDKRNFLIEIKNPHGRNRKTDQQRRLELAWNGQFDYAETLDQAIDIIFGPSKIQGGNRDRTENR